MSDSRFNILERSAKLPKAGRAEVWVTCGHCNWTWICYAPLPAPMEVVARAMRQANCPHCVKRPSRLFMATEADISAVLAKLNAVSPPDGTGAGELPPQSPSSPAPISSHQESSNG